MEVKLINYTTNPVAAIEEAATTCYDSQPTDGRIMRHCYKSGHHSVLEFADFTFRIKGADPPVGSSPHGEFCTAESALLRGGRL